jgi:hypothetical protein
MEKQLTAVEWLAKNLKDFPHVKHSQLFRDLVEQAKEMEKEQIIDAYNTSFSLRDKPYSTADKYYNETFKSE